MKVYLDNCCFNRPFDDQTQLVVRLETDAKLYVQALIRSRELELCWSFVLDYENTMNPFEDVRDRIGAWKYVAVSDCVVSDRVSEKASQLMRLGLRQMDAAHIACAILLGADCFLTTDRRILNKPISEITVINPIDFVRRYPYVE